MSDQSPVLPLFISTFSMRYSAAMNGRAAAISMSSSITWPVVNAAFYIPMFLPFHYPVRRVFWTVGGVGTAVNVDFGIYTASGARIYSTTSTALTSSTAAVQYVTPTAFILTPGAYYFAMSASATTASRFGVGSTGQTLPNQALSGLLQEASALPLPAVMTPVACANVCYPYCGVTRTATGF